MATSAIIPSESLDIDRIVIGDIARMNPAGGKTVPIRYNGQTLVVRTPRIFYPAGVVTRVDEQNKSNYNLLASLKGCDPYAKEMSTDGSDIGNFYNILLKLQEKILASAVANSVNWFGKVRSEAVLRDTMKLMLTPSVDKVGGEWVPNGKYPPSLRMKITVWDGAVKMNVVDKDNNEIVVTPENLEQVFPKRMEGRMVVAPSIYVTGLGFGITWRVQIAKVFPPESRSASDVFKDIVEKESAPPPAESESTDLPTVDAPPTESDRSETPPNRANTGGATAPPAPGPKKRKSQVAPA